MREKKAKVVSLVPSWTETLLRAGADVVGRTRFCIHPAELVSAIPVVGGTKNMKLGEILRLKPDLVIMDQEENRLEMAEALRNAGVEIMASQVSDYTTAADFLSKLSERLQLPMLADFAHRYRSLRKTSRSKFLLGCISAQNSEIPATAIEYVIWRKPFMVIGKGTFIAAVLQGAGFELLREEKYPKISPQELLNSYSFFSTEPFPFAEEFPVLSDQGYRGALIDGEKVSWYGIRNLEFMESCAE